MKTNAKRRERARRSEFVRPVAVRGPLWARARARESFTCVRPSATDMLAYTRRTSCAGFGDRREVVRRARARAQSARRNWFKISLHRRKKNKHRLHDSLRFDATQVQPVREYYYYSLICAPFSFVPFVVRECARARRLQNIYAVVVVAF